MKKTRLLYTLIVNYVVFSLCVGIIGFWIAFQWDEKTNNRFLQSESSVLSAQAVAKMYAGDNTASLLDVGGWVEFLDSDRKIVHVIGSKLDDMPAYTERDLNELMYDRADRGYYVSLAPIPDSTDNRQFVLIKIPADQVVDKPYLSSILREDQTYFLQISVAAAAVFLVMFAANVYLYSRWTAKRITEPLDSISKGLNLMMLGKYNTRLHMKANYEIVRIRDRFNVLAERLEKSEKERSLLEESKQRMLADISHDLRTPITSIQGYAEALYQDMIADDGQKRKYLKLIRDKSAFVGMLIDDLFELSKLSHADYRLNKETDDLAEFIREIMAVHYDELENKGLALLLEIPEHRVMCEFDKNKMKRAVSNLLSNAIRYAASSGFVKIELKETKRHLELRIQDTGAGIAPSLRDSVFEPFVRGDGARKSDGGTGLGLAIVKQIVEKHNGTVELEKETPPGIGASFLLTLPKP